MIRQEQSIIFTQQMIKGLSFLQMNKIMLMITLDKISQSNPFIRNTPNTVLPEIIEETLQQEQKLYDQLREELFLNLSEEDFLLLRLIIGNLNSQGFLEISCQKLCQNTSISPKYLEQVRNKIQKSSYKGLASYNHKEYLSLLVETIYGTGSIEYKIAQFSDKKYSLNKLKKLFPKQNIQKGLENLKKLPLSPLNGESITVLPDFIIKTDNDELQISPVKYNNTIIDVSNTEEYRSVYSAKELNKFIGEANQLRYLLETRSTTLQKHAEALILLRKDFFLPDTITIPSVSLKDVADITGRHISTVSRTLKERYFLFQNNIYPFSILWTHKVGAYTNEEIKHKILEIVNHESSPLSDDMITSILNKQGIKIARRTVTKYREQLNIGSIYQR